MTPDRDMPGQAVAAHDAGQGRADQADADQGDALEIRTIGHGSGGAPGDEFGHRGDHGAHVFLEADGDAQASGQAVAVHLAGDDPAARQMGAGGRRGVRAGKLHQDEIGHAGMDGEAESGQLGAEPG